MIIIMIYIQYISSVIDWLVNFPKYLRVNGTNRSCSD